MDRKFFLFGTLIFIFIYYAMGVGFLSHPERGLRFHPWIFWTLLLTIGLVVIWDRSEPRRRLILLMGHVFLIGFVLEGIGVATGKVFGTYQYGQNLGPQLFAVPLLIGLNWCWLVYATASIFHGLSLSRWVGMIGSSVAMVVYDGFLEDVAPRLGMWTWADGVVPSRNFIAWGILSLFFHGMLVSMKVRVRNPMAGWVFFIQILFLSALGFFLPGG